MAKHIEAFFPTENDAEGAKSELQKLKIEKELIEPIPEDTDLTPIVPIVSSTNAGSGSLNFNDVLEPIKNQDDSMRDKKQLTHVLHFYLQEEHYDQAIEVIKNHHGHMDEKKL
ncbi:hypothetical protein EQV77_10665 [Halobacillus fulvus]|nr:hypothetical protein EQV77_10665 [Halobacillus fulvus]